jgi:hypothetical protein
MNRRGFIALLGAIPFLSLDSFSPLTDEESLNLINDILLEHIIPLAQHHVLHDKVILCKINKEIEKGVILE